MRKTYELTCGAKIPSGKRLTKTRRDTMKAGPVTILTAKGGQVQVVEGPNIIACENVIKEFNAIQSRA